MKYIKWILLALVVVAIVGLRQSGLGQFLSLEYLLAEKDSFLTYIETNYVTAIIAFIAIYIAVVALSIPGASVLTLSGGLLFGAIWGTVYIVIGATLGAIAAFVAARYFLGDWIHKKYEDKLKKFNAEVKDNAASYLLTLRLIPLFPFFLINLLAGLTKVPLRTFAWTTALGIIPGTFVYAFAGAQLNTIESVGDIISGPIIMAFVLLGLFALVPVVYKKVKARKK